jgi:undecaprenyl-diphosphatase
VSDLLLAWDAALFHFLNTTLATPAGDVLWPLITHYDRFPAVRVALLAAWVLLVVKGGRRGRLAALAIIPVIIASDQLNSTVIKDLVARPRPCHFVNGVRVIGDLRLLVDCGPGYAFMSSHAVNNAAAATVFSHYYPRWSWAFILWAVLVGISRVFVGVHFPLDVVAGAVLGASIATAMVTLVDRAAAGVTRRRPAPGPEART